MKKYPRTYHFLFSPEVQSDDKVLSLKDLGNFISEEYVILEKMDGQNNCFKDGQLYARSHQLPTKHEWDTYLSNLCYSKDMNPNYDYFFENLYAIHSIEYTNLSTYIFLINIHDKTTGEVLSWDEVEAEGRRLNIKTPKVIFRGTVKSMVEYKKLMENQIRFESSEGGECEGFIARPVKRFYLEDFTKKVGKYVRKGHVQTDVHWRNNWKKAKLKLSVCFNPLYGLSNEEIASLVATIVPAKNEEG